MEEIPGHVARLQFSQGESLKANRGAFAKHQIAQNVAPGALRCRMMAGRHQPRTPLVVVIVKPPTNSFLTPVDSCSSSSGIRSQEEQNTHLAHNLGAHTPRRCVFLKNMSWKHET